MFHQEILERALADNTRIAYAKGWDCFCKYCAKYGTDPMNSTSEDIANFLIEVSTYPNPSSGKILSMSTVSLYMSAINSKFCQNGRTSPTQHPKVKYILRGLQRANGKIPRRVKALREHHVLEILQQCDRFQLEPKKKMISLRDAAIISIGFAGALRRSELCNLTTDDIEILSSERDCVQPNSNKIVNSVYMKMNLTVRKSKTDREGRGQIIPIIDGNNLNPIRRLMEWLSASGISEGYLFQTMRRGGAVRGKPMHHSDIPRLVKYYANLIGLDSSDYAGHSLRSGFVTSAVIHNARLDKIMEITRHTNPATVMKYIRDADSFQDHAGQNFL